MNLDLTVDRRSGSALYEQIAESIRAAVRSGRLGPGVKLPSSREIARQLDVHRRTVVQAFHLLEREGWVSSGVGQGTFVRERSDTRSAAVPPFAPNGFSWDAALRRNPAAQQDLLQYWSRWRPLPGVIGFTGATADPSFFPAEDFRAILEEVFKTHGASALDYGPTEGYEPLREWVAERLRSRGVNVDAAEVMIVSGSQQGLDLLGRLLLREGDTALVEEPGYPHGFRLFQAGGARAVGVPVDEGGVRCDALEHICASASPRLLYVMPIFQNPTGLSLAPGRAASLLEICARYRVPVIEDQFDAELVYDGPVPEPLRARDGDGLVVLLGSFSKILFPGLRLGWMVVPPPLAAPLRELKQMADFSSGLLAQYAMDLYCRRGLLDRHLERVRGIYGSRLQVMLEAMSREFPSGAEWTRPRGGLTLWVSLPPGVDSLELLARARREGVDFSPGPLFFPGGGGTGSMRLSYIRETEERIRRGIAVLGRLLRAGTPDGSPAAPFF